MLFRRRRGGALVGGSAAPGAGPEQRIGTRFVMRQKMFAFGDDFTVTDEQGRKAFSVDGKDARIVMGEALDAVKALVAAGLLDPAVVEAALEDETPAGTEEA